VTGGSTAPTEEIVAAGLEAAKPFIATLCDAQGRARRQVPEGRPPEFPLFLDYSDDVYAAVSDAATGELSEVLSIADKQAREEATEALKAKIVTSVAPSFEGREKEISGAFRALDQEAGPTEDPDREGPYRRRGVSDIRTLSAEVGVLPRVHGSALFQRGETQILGVSTLNMLGMEQKLDTLAPETTKRYMHNYNFPPYSTGETGPGRLAEAARDRPRRARRAGAGARCCRRARSSPTPSAGVGGPRFERLHLDGVGLRLDPRPAERRCAAARAGRRHRHGPGLRHVDGETRYVALTDILGAEGRVRRHGLQGRRHRNFITALQLDTKLAGIPASCWPAA
jgi:polyribonucleotide nucleotidyltransferase